MNVSFGKYTFLFAICWLGQQYESLLEILIIYLQSRFHISILQIHPSLKICQKIMRKYMHKASVVQFYQSDWNFSLHSSGSPTSVSRRGVVLIRLQFYVLASAGLGLNKINNSLLLKVRFTYFYSPNTSFIKNISKNHEKVYAQSCWRPILCAGFCWLGP